MDFTSYNLGEDDDVLNIERLADHRAAAVHLASLARREVIICSRCLDPIVYNQREFRDALQAAAINNSHFTAKILVFEIANIRQNGRFLLELATFLSSFFTVRLASKEHQQYNGSILLVDNTGYLYRHNANRFDGHLSFNDKSRSRAIHEEFDKMWREARPDSNLRRFLI